MAHPDQLIAEATRHQRDGRLEEAESLYSLVLAAHPDHIAALVNRGAALRAMGRLDESECCLARAVALRPDLSQAHNNLGNVRRELGRLDGAIAAYRKALELSPDDAEARSNLGTVLKDTGRLDEAIACYRAAIALRPDSAEAHSNLVYAMMFHPGVDSGEILAECLRWGQRFPAPRLEPARPNPIADGRRLRIGYVGADFRDHCQSFFTVPVFEHHDRDRFHIHCYASVSRPDDITRRLRGAVESWRDVRAAGDDTIAAMVRSDGIDILVDLTMHMAGGRLGVFARKPAPVQVTWLAYPGTTGVGAIDYRLTDPHLDPPGRGDEFYSERSFRLPDSFWCYDPLSAGPPVNGLPALTNGFVTFGCLNNFCKVNDRTLRLWAGVMRRVPRSRLIMLAPEGGHRGIVSEILGTEGIEPARVEFVAPRPRPDYLRLYHRIDVCLDTLPYNGHTTTLDAMWMGVPVVTRRGDTVVGRAGVSHLVNLGLAELIGDDDGRFTGIAAGLVSDLSRLSRLRGSLRERMIGSPLMDASRFPRGLEAAYCAMWTELRGQRGL